RTAEGALLADGFRIGHEVSDRRKARCAGSAAESGRHAGKLRMLWSTPHRRHDVPQGSHIGVRGAARTGCPGKARATWFQIVIRRTLWTSPRHCIQRVGAGLSGVDQSILATPAIAAT